MGCHPRRTGDVDGDRRAVERVRQADDERSGDELPEQIALRVGKGDSVLLVCDEADAHRERAGVSCGQVDVVGRGEVVTRRRCGDDRRDGGREDQECGTGRDDETIEHDAHLRWVATDGGRPLTG